MTVPYAPGLVTITLKELAVLAPFIDQKLQRFGRRCHFDKADRRATRLQEANPATKDLARFYSCGAADRHAQEISAQSLGTPPEPRPSRARTRNQKLTVAAR